LTYTVERTPRFDAEFAGLSREHPIVQDMLDGLVFVLARTPKTHPHVPGTPYRVAVSQQGDPALRVYYAIEVRLVTLVSCDLAV
jgi:hypothetical protein